MRTRTKTRGNVQFGTKVLKKKIRYRIRLQFDDDWCDDDPEILMGGDRDTNQAVDKP